MGSTISYGWLAAATAAFAIVGCTPTIEHEQTGFLSDYSRLEEVSENHLFFSTGRIGEYSQFILDPVQMLFIPDPDNPAFTQEDLEELKQHFDDEIKTRLTEKDGYPIVTEPGRGVARLRAAITDVDETHGAANILIYTKITGAGLGGVAAEGELVDSVSGEQLAAALRWGGGSRVLRAGFTKMGDAKLAIDRWAKDFRERVDKAHGRD